MISTSDLIHLPYSPDLSEGGVEFALRSLAHTRERDGLSPYSKLRRMVAGLAVEVAFRRYLSQNNIPFDVKPAKAFNDLDRFDVFLNGHRCDLKSFLISNREQILQIRNQPAILLNAPALVPSDVHAGDGHAYSDLYLFAFVAGLAATSYSDLQKVLAKKLPHALVHVLPPLWRRPKEWMPLGKLILKSESNEEVQVEVIGQDQQQGLKRILFSLPPGVKVQTTEEFYSITALRVRHLPEARVGVYCSQANEMHIIGPRDWSNIWVYGMDVIFAGYASYEEMSQRATLLAPGVKTFQYEHTHVKNLAIPVSKLKPLRQLWS